MQSKKYLDDTGLKYFYTKLKELFNINELDFLIGSNNVNTLVNVPINKRMVYANLNNNNSFSLQSVPANGKNIHILIKNKSAKPIVISLPTALPYAYTNIDTLNIPANSIGEINALSNGTEIYLRAV